MQPYLPLGTLYAATALRDRGISSDVFDVMLEAPEPGFIAALRNSEAKIVVVYEDDFNFLSKMCLTRMREVAWHMASAAKDADAITVVHGSDATDNPQLFLENHFDYVLCGEAENLLADLCRALLNGAEVSPSDGLVCMDASGRLLRGSQRLARNPAWSELAFPARDLVDLEPYRSAWTSKHGYFSTNMVASRGCPFRCNWCAKPISSNHFQLRSASAVADEMLLLKRAGVEHIWFGDDIFALNHHWVEQFARELADRDAALPFKIQSRVDLMREDTVRHLRASGCTEVWMGVESGSQIILNAMDKGITLDQVAVARERLRLAGIRACFFLQFGYPGETWTELQQTINLVRRLQPDDIGISFSYPLPGTVFYDRVQSQLGVKRNWIESNDLCIMFKAAYTTEFYRAVRDALHAEVNSWTKSKPECNEIDSMWQAVEHMEPLSRVSDPLVWGPELELASSPVFVSADSLIAPTGSRQ
ncbi:MAG TPA: radical SAM protein [Acidobacteriaceae bacterium]|nr:radical SAM protein [Acidobacteriaceae bacterium]